MEEKAQQILQHIDAQINELTKYEYIDLINELLYQLESRKASVEYD
jgi:hypothetical protein